MSCVSVGEIAWDTLVQNTLDFTLYTTYISEGNAGNVPEDLDGKTFSAVVYNGTEENGSEEDVYARAIGASFDDETGKVELLTVSGTKCRIKATFPAAAVTDKEWEYAKFLIHDITDTANPIKRVEGAIRLKKSAAPVIAP